MAKHRPYQNPLVMSLDERAEQRRATLDKRQALLSKMAQASAARSQTSSSTPATPKIPPRKQRDVDRYIAALAAQPFHQLGLGADGLADAPTRRDDVVLDRSRDGGGSVVHLFLPLREQRLPHLEQTA